MESFDVIIVGGGVAGLSTAWHLARAGVTRTCVLEREWACGTRASGTNAAIFRTFDDDAPGVTLARRTRELLDELADDGPLLRERGALYVGAAARLAPGLAELERQRVRVVRDAPASGLTLRPGEEAVLLPGDGVLDLHGMIQALLRRLRAAGVSVRTGIDALPLGPATPGKAVRGVTQLDASRCFVTGEPSHSRA